MKEHPILFRAPEVRALLAGRKTQARVPVKLPAASSLGTWEPSVIGGPGVRTVDGRVFPEQPVLWHTRTGATVACPHGVGDLLWALETWASGYGRGCWGTLFAADGAFAQGVRRHEKGPHFNAEDRPVIRWKPSIHMPRWASRITLEVTSVRVERLQDISEEDARADGIVTEPDYSAVNHLSGRGAAPGMRWSARLDFRDLWDSLNSARAPWASNPWVWVRSFRRVQP